MPHLYLVLLQVESVGPTETAGPVLSLLVGQVFAPFKLKLLKLFIFVDRGFLLLFFWGHWGWWEVHEISCILVPALFLVDEAVLTRPWLKPFPPSCAYLSPPCWC